MRTLLLIIVSVAFSIAGTLFVLKQQGGQSVSTKTETAYDRMINSGTLRCGYFVWPPMVTKDPNTGQLGGLTYDFTMALAKATDLKVEWTQEMQFATYLQDLGNGKFDMECAAGWPNAKRGKIAFYGEAYAYVPLVLVRRTGDERFHTPEALNNPEVKIATPDGETSGDVTSAKFPKATRIDLSQTTRADEMIMNVTTKKADATLLDLITVLDYQAKNPGEIEYERYDPPLHLIAIAPTLPADPRLKNMVDIATQQLINNGTVESLLQKYEPYPGAFLRVAPMYQKGTTP